MFSFLNPIHLNIYLNIHFFKVIDGLIVYNIITVTAT